MLQATEINQACIHTLFEEQAYKNPDTIALVCDDIQISYEQLNTRANQLASYLQHTYNVTSQKIGFYLERSPEMIICVLGILKAGCAYVPLALDNPTERIQFMLEDAEISLLLTHSKLHNTISQMASTAEVPSQNLQIVSLDQAFEDISQESKENLALAMNNNDLAYVTYTSGTTGQPKAALIPHRSIPGFHYNVSYATFDLHNVFLQYSSISWDAFTLELWPALLHGARCVLYIENTFSLHSFSQTLECYHITLVWLTSTLFNIIIDEVPEALKHIRQLLIGGESVSIAHVRRALNLLPEVQIINGYGPSECTVFACCYPISRAWNDNIQTIPIGYPIGDRTLYLLDEKLQRVPMGISGEIYIAGPSLALGYLHQPEMTAQSFVPHPFSPEPGARLYKTGDLARFLPNGSLEFLGRIDRQVKIRGFRIELGEIETILGQHEYVQQVYVHVHIDLMQSKQLVAYLVLRTDQPQIHDQLRTYLAQRLPDYMIPMVFIVLKHFPITSHGKVDYNALPVPDWSQMIETTQLVQPGNKLEALVPKIRQDVSRRETISVTDNFPAIGNHSPLATKIIARLYKRLGINSPAGNNFSSSTITDLEAFIEQQLVDKQPSENAMITPVDRTNIIPQTIGQQSLWFLEQLLEKKPVYTIPLILQFDGTLQYEILEQSFNAIINRHESLRTTFHEQNGKLIQRIQMPYTLAISFIDVSDLSPAQFEQAIQPCLQAAIQRPFDLEQGPLLRAHLFRVHAQKHLLQLTMHHIIFDGHSINILLDELIQHYSAYARLQPSPLPANTLQYADFATWQQQHLQTTAMQRQLAYWKEQLNGLAPLLNIPADHRRPTIPSWHGATTAFQLSPDLYNSLKTLARQEEVTLYMVLLAALQTLLLRYTQQDDIAIGTPIANRLQHETENIIGYFVNTLVMRTNLQGNPSFQELLQRTKKVTLQAFDHQEIPFEQIIEMLHPKREMNFTPFVQIMLTLQNSFTSTWSVPNQDLAIQVQEQSNCTAKFDLTIHFYAEEDSLRGMVEYNLDLFEAETIDRLINHLTRLMEHVVDHPNLNLLAIPLLGEQDRQLVLTDFNSAPEKSVEAVRLHEMFAKQENMTPDAIAVVENNIQVTYEYLHQCANQLAHYLQKLDVGPEVRVGFCFEPSIEMIIGFLSIIKAGGVYVPLDPEYPGDRLAYIIDNAQIQVLLTQTTLNYNMPVSSIPVIYMDADREEIAQYPREAPITRTYAENLLYIIYTSGSTGKPKGVEVEQRQLLNYLHSILQQLELRPGEHVATVSTIVSDLGKTIVYSSLATGGRLHIVSQEQATDPDKLRAMFVLYAFETFKTLPSHLATLLACYQPEQLLPRRLLMLGGEALLHEWVQQIQQLKPGCIVLNHYGPTETTLGVMTHRILTTGESNPDNAVVALGRPLPHTQIYLLDSQLAPVPIGITGEIYIGGQGLTRGYSQQPNLTAEKFIPNPFSTKPGTRIYRTGDLARCRLDGTFEFVGRIDNQIKLRGFRIELGEIENVLSQHPLVKATVAIVHNEQSTEDGKQLVAYVVPAQFDQAEEANIVKKLKSHIRGQLPAYMMPSAFVLLQNMPQTPNGKIDRNALPHPTHNYFVQNRDIMPPRSPIEEMLVEIWQEVLKHKHISIYDKFFDIGGHSLLATQIISRMRTLFQIDLPLRALFEKSTIADLAELIENKQHNQQEEVSKPSITAASKDSTPLLSFAQQRLWLLHQLEPDSLAYNVHAVSKLQGTLSLDILEYCLHEIVRQHDILRTNFVIVDGSPQQIISTDVLPDIRFIDLSHYEVTEQEAKITWQIKQETLQPFDLAHGPLIRLRLLRRNSQEHLLVLIMHHIISDGWSLEVIIKELAALYIVHTTQKPTSRTEPVLQYKDFALWQRQWLQGSILDDQLAYWKQQLAHTPPLELTIRKTAQVVNPNNGAYYSSRLSQDLTTMLSRVSNQNRCTLFMTLLAAFQTLLYRYSGQEEIAVGTPIANRHIRETENMIGFFANTLVMKTDLAANLSFQEVLERVRTVTLGAYAHQDLPFDILVEALQPERSLKHNPLFQVMAVFAQGTLSTLQVTDELTFSPPDRYILTGTAKFDLTLVTYKENNELVVSFEYNKDVFDEGTIARLAAHFRVVVEAMVTNPQQLVANFPLLTTTEYQQLVIEQNRTAARQEKHPTRSMLTLFEQQVEAKSDTIALVFEDAQITYAELSNQVNHIAAQLLKKGIQPGTSVGLCIDRSLELVIGVLGIFKAGGVFVALDPTSPPERFAFIMHDAHVSIILTQPLFASLLQPYEIDFIYLTPQNTPQKAPNTTYMLRAENWAYMVYTSGSTGKPKGVIVNHGSLTSIAEAWRSAYGLTAPNLIHLQLANFAFDVFLGDLTRSLCNGGRLVLCSQETLLLAPQLYTTMRREHIQYAEFVPALMHNLMRYTSETHQTLSFMHTLIIGSDSWTQKDYQQFRAICGSETRIINSYGLTETTIDNLYYEPEGTILVPEQKMPIGLPYANTTAYILDQQLQPLPPEVPGELYIGGLGVTQGYYQRPDLTAEYFIPDPFSEKAGARLYRTRDLACYQPDGTIELIGRLDTQLKLRGLRIEPGEIEFTITQYPHIQQAVVLLHGSPPTEQNLVAYIVMLGEQTLDDAALRTFLKTRLPEQMIPIHYIQLTELPLTYNGKIDRMALPAPTVPTSHQMPNTIAEDSVESVISTLWSQLLNIKQNIDRQANFFSLGGHSLIAAQLIWQLREILQVDVPLRKIFEEPTLAGFAAVVQHQQTQMPTTIDVIPILDRDDTEDLLMQVDQMSAEEIDLLLNDLMED